jgi:hypothetical protein
MGSEQSRLCCSICGNDVSLTTCKADGHGRMVHEFCYYLQLAAESRAVVECQRQEVSEARYRSWNEIAMDVVREQDPQRFEELVEELEAALAFREFSRRQGELAFLLPRSNRMAYEEIVDIAVTLMRSDYASLQMLFPERGTGGDCGCSPSADLIPRPPDFGSGCVQIRKVRAE